MSIEKIPKLYLKNDRESPDLFLYDLKMSRDIIKSKVDLTMNMISFLQVGKKQVYFSDISVDVNEQQSLILKKGNCIWTELLDKDSVYYCKLLFFSEHRLLEFLNKYCHGQQGSKETSYFIIENDDYIASYLKSLSRFDLNATDLKKKLLSVKFEELFLYLMDKYGNAFELFLRSLISKEYSSFKKTVESNVYSNLKLEEIAFLCHMSLSSFKRNFVKEYKESPGKWLIDKRLRKAKEILEEGRLKPSDIYFEYGYNNLSNFSIAFKKKFGISPNEIRNGS
ncbi:MAG TPA: AraC family transcriptional regulator [Arenibacter sp.]|nr:AraC family transcriptional regulator [Arenibacter sp.]